MKRNEILKMPAGREMDVLIAEKVMKYKPGTFGVDAPVKSQHGDWIVRPVPFYSTDIAAAWEVVNKIHTMVDGHSGLLDDDQNYLTLVGGDWAATFGVVFDDDEWYDHLGEWPLAAKAETAPLAICRAALLVIATDNIGA
jgi:hypothetical protein